MPFFLQKQFIIRRKYVYRWGNFAKYSKKKILKAGYLQRELVSLSNFFNSSTYFNIFFLLICLKL